MRPGERSGFREVQLDELPTDVRKAVRKALRDSPRFMADQMYFEHHRKELLRKYDGQWVAVYKQRVVAHDPSLDQVIAALNEQGRQPSEAAIHFVTSEERKYFGQAAKPTGVTGKVALFCINPGS